MALDYISIGWVWLERTLNRMIEAINAQKVIGSTTVAVEESPNGTLLKAMPGGAAGGVQPGMGMSGGWHQLAVIDNSTGTCVTKYLWYWGTAAVTTPGPPPQ